MPVMTGKRALMEMLRAENIGHIFGNPGTSESPIMDALEDFPDLRYILTTQEGVAMGMADGYARATHNPSFVNLHIETGLANGISLLTNAYDGGTPLVLTSGNKDIRKLTEGRTDLVQMVKQFTKWSAEVTHPEQMPSAIRRAFKEAKTPPTGPTYLAFSANALDDEGQMEIIPSSEGYLRIGPDMRAIEDASNLLSQASSPIIVIGDRVAQSGASSETVRVAELIGAKVYATSYSQMIFPTAHPQFMGLINHGNPNSRKLLSSADVILAIGAEVFSHVYFYFSRHCLDQDTKLIHIDQDPHEIDKIEPTNVGIVSDPKIALGHLSKALESGMSGSAKKAAEGRTSSVSKEKFAQKAAWQNRLKDRWDQNPMSPERMMVEIASVLPTDTIIVDDSVTSRDSIHGSIEFSRQDSIYGATGGALGWGMGGALGAKLAHPDRPVVAIVGDGSAMMTVQALWTAANENIPVVYIICNNKSYRVLKLNMNTYKTQIVRDESPPSEYLGMDFPIPLNIAGIAEAIGVYGRKIEDPSELAPTMRNALETGKPAVLDVIIDGSV